MNQPLTLETELIQALGYQVVTPASANWQRASQPWNIAVHQDPLAVVTVETVEQIRSILAVASHHGAKVTTQLTGHGANHQLADAIVVRPSGFDELVIDVEHRTARIGAGVRWGAVAAALDGTGLVAAFGSNPSVGVTGYELAGGVSLFSRSTGLGSWALRAVELVTADGISHRVTDGDLLWALRGAGGSFGIVTAVEIDLYPAADVYGGKLLFGLDEAGDVLDAVLSYGADADPKLNMSVNLTQMPTRDDISPMLQGQRLVSLDAFGFDNETEHMRTLDAIRSQIPPIIDDAMGHLAVSGVHKAINEPVKPSASGDFSRLARVDRAMIDSLVDLFETADGQVLRNIQVRLLGGRLAQDPLVDAIAGAIHDPHLVLGVGPAVPGDERVDRAYARLGEVVAVDGKPRTVASFLTRGQDYTDAYDEVAMARWRAVRAEVNPDGVIISNRDPQ
ncbi:FAD-binding oxidoreductase [Rarobacter incanus]|uniref:FAD/FMN-containing dehydrogenase n=1 Tax=Rarobacter incanus TaxID=153494 RepID=A0A542SPK9_9MICO|nr:FAD-binding protein [Rarobacter incanus]TQK76550.1 FAD/FMN-containing dehydrogenase [Rarobacter incanus]